MVVVWTGLAVLNWCGFAVAVGAGNRDVDGLFCVTAFLFTLVALVEFRRS
jgi:hypothetical protein